MVVWQLPLVSQVACRAARIWNLLFYVFSLRRKPPEGVAPPGKQSAAKPARTGRGAGRQRGQGELYCLNALIDKGLVRIQNFRNNRNKRVYVYLLPSKGIAEKAEMTMQFLQRKMVEYELLRKEIESLQQDLNQQPQ